NPKAQPAPGHTGLYHFAVLMPSRAHLGASLQRLIDSGYPIQGAADHLVSEAVYLADPDGSGIELYRDRRRDQWPTLDGQLQMDNAPLDAQGILAAHQSDPQPWEGLHPGTIIGHMHLHVAAIPAAESFYNETLGLDRVLAWHSASFLSAGGYHHHLGINTWGTESASPPPPNSTGLREFSLILPSSSDLETLLARLQESGLDITQTADGPLLHDPSQNALLLTSA
ncbi:MAG: VOC family protein, partial [Anaerolineae bacterium]|nr:VOC family protein [Anaerolineae bacterium]